MKLYVCIFVFVTVSCIAKFAISGETGRQYTFGQRLSSPIENYRQRQDHISDREDSSLSETTQRPSSGNESKATDKHVNKFVKVQISWLEQLMSSAKKKPLAEADKEMKRAKKKDTFKPEMKPGKHMTGKTSGPPLGFANSVVSEKENESVYVPPMPRPTMVAKKEEVTNQRLQRIHECIMKEHFEFSEPNVDRIIEVTSKTDPKNMCRPYLEQIDELRSHCRPRSYHRQWWKDIPFDS